MVLAFMGMPYSDSTECNNISNDELHEFRRLATAVLAYNDAELRAAIEHGPLTERSNA